MNIKLKQVLSLALCIAVSGLAQAQQMNPLQVLQNDKTVLKKTLPNGLTYYIKKNTEPKKRAVLYMVEKVGSTSENDQQQGLAHFLEHMAFNGTKTFPKNQLIDYLQKSGVKFGADLNAQTSFNETIYQLPVPTDTASVFQKSFQILADWAGGMLLQDKEIDSERGVIIEEDRQRGKNAGERMGKQLYPLLFYKSRYENRIPIGKIPIIQNFKYNEIRDFYKTWYRPNLQAVVAVGDFDVKEVEKLIVKNFSALKNPAKPKVLEQYPLSPNATPLVKVVTDPEQPYTIGLVYFKNFSAKPVRTIADVKREMAKSLINTMLAARIKEATESGKAPYLFAQASYGDFQGGLDPSVEAFQSVAVAKDAASINVALKSILSETYRMAEFGFSEAELDITKKDFAEQNETDYKEKDKTESVNFVNQYVANFLKNEIYLSKDDDYQLSKNLLNEISINDINQLAKSLISDKNQTIVVQAPEKDKANLPNEASLLATVKSASEGLKAYEYAKIDKPLIDPMPAAGKTVKTENIADLGITKLTLSNGVNVYLKPTTFKNDESNSVPSSRVVYLYLIILSLEIV